MNPLLIIICILFGQFLQISGYLTHLNQLECDDVIFDPLSIFLTNNTLYKYESCNAKLLIDSNIYNTKSFSRVKSACQQIFLKNPNFTLAEAHYYSSRVPSKVVQISEKDTVLMTTSNKLPYDFDQIVIINGKMYTRKYSAIDDKRWRQLKVAYTVFAPFLFEDSQGKLTGINFDIWKIIGAKLGLTFNIKNKHATYAENYQKIAPGLIDLALPQDSLWISQYQFADPTHFLFYERFMFLNIKPGPVTTLFTLIYPFDTMTWLLLGLSFMFACVAIHLINVKSSLSYFHTFQILLSPFLSEPLPNIAERSRRNWYGCLVLMVWPLSGLLLSAAYSSNLLANLTVVEKEAADNTFEDLVNNERTLGIPKGTILEFWMKNSPRDIVRKVEKECVRARDGYYDGLSSKEIEHPQMRERLENEKASNIVMLSIFPKFQHKYRLGTDVLMDTFSTYYMRRRHPIKDVVDVQMGRLTDTGITSHIKDRYIWNIARFGRDHERNAETQNADHNKITIKHLYPLWIILCLCLSITILSFIGETCIIGHGRIGARNFD